MLTFSKENCYTASLFYFVCGQESLSTSVSKYIPGNFSGVSLFLQVCFCQTMIVSSEKTIDAVLNKLKEILNRVYF